MRFSVSDEEKQQDFYNGVSMMFTWAIMLSLLLPIAAIPESYTYDANGNILNRVVAGASIQGSTPNDFNGE